MLDRESEISEIVCDGLEIYHDWSVTSCDMRDAIYCESTFDDL